MDLNRHAYIRAVKYELGLNWFYELQPSRMKLPMEKEEEKGPVYLNQNGSNLGNVLWYLKKNYPDNFRNLKRSLKDAIPTIEDLEIAPFKKWIFVFILKKKTLL